MSETTRERALEWYANTLSSRLNDKQSGAIVLVMQRLHEEVLAGHLLEAGGWQELSLAAIAEERETVQLSHNRAHTRQAREALHPKREPIELLEQQRSMMGSANFSAQYQQSPVPAEGNMVGSEWLHRYNEAPTRRPGDVVVQSWDTASKTGPLNDYSVCITALRRGRKSTS